MFNEFIGANRVKDLVVAEFAQEKVLIEADAPLEEALSHLGRLQLGEEFVYGTQSCELESIPLIIGSG